MTRAAIALVSLASLSAATVVTGFAISRALATDGAAPATSCSTTTACVEGDNTSSGPGVKGTSAKGHGVVGTTKSKGTQTTAHAGVLGQDLQTGLGGVFNDGVEGTSTDGTGVFGSSTNSAGVEGISPNGTGVGGMGGSNNFGVIGQAAVGVAGFANAGSTVGVEAANSTTGDAFLAYGTGGNLFRGNNSHSLDVFAVDDAGDVSAAGNVSASNVVDGLQGLFGTQGLNGEGVLGASATEGVEGQNSTTGDAIFANGYGGLLFRGNNSSGQNVFEVDDTGEVYAVGYTLIADATKLQHTSSGQTVKTYSSQAAQPTLEDTGEAQLVDGLARVALDPAFAATIDRSNYIVLVTPEGMTRGVLCVTQRTPSGFVIQENMGGRSSVPFAYRIVGKPYGSTAPRLPFANVPGQFGQRVPKTKIAPRIYQAQHHARPVIKRPSF